MEEHTPGPFVYSEREDGEGFRVDSEGELLPYLHPVAIVPIDGRSRGEAEANARLFAVAPKLLEACRKVVATYGAEKIGHAKLTEAEMAKFDALCHVIEAIAEAEGDD